MNTDREKYAIQGAINRALLFAAIPLPCPAECPQRQGNARKSAQHDFLTL